MIWQNKQKPWGHALRLTRPETRDQTYTSANSITPRAVQMVAIYSPHCPIFFQGCITLLPSPNHSFALQIYKQWVNCSGRGGGVSAGFRDAPGQGGLNLICFMMIWNKKAPFGSILKFKTFLIFRHVCSREFVLLRSAGCRQSHMELSRSFREERGGTKSELLPAAPVNTGKARPKQLSVMNESRCKTKFLAGKHYKW